MQARVLRVGHGADRRAHRQLPVRLDRRFARAAAFLTPHESELGTDLDQLKLTLPLIHCLANLPTHEADQLRTALENKDERQAIVQEVKPVDDTRVSA